MCKWRTKKHKKSRGEAKEALKLQMVLEQSKRDEQVRSGDPRYLFSFFVLVSHLFETAGTSALPTSSPLLTLILGTQGIGV